MKTIGGIMCVAVIGVLLCASTCFGDLPQPAGLGPGDSYHLAFISGTKRKAISMDITEYDAFVQGLADAAGIGVTEGVVWHVIGSTATENARDHALVSAPVYRTDETLVATGFDDMWDGALLAHISYTETGSLLLNLGQVWTGTDPSGTVSATHALGSALPTYGYPSGSASLDSHGRRSPNKSFAWDRTMIALRWFIC